MPQPPRLRNTPGGAKCFAWEGGAFIDNRRGVCAAAGSCRRRPGARSGGPDEDATPVGVSTGGPASAGGASSCGSRGRGATGQRVRLSRGRVRVRVPPSPLEQGRGAGRPRRPHKPQIVGSNPTPAIVPTWLSGDGTGFVHRLRKDGVGFRPTVGPV